MMSEVYGVIRKRFENQGMPTEGWVFCSAAKCGHYNQGTAKKHHAKALRDSKMKPFQPYTLRHTALTNLGKRCDPFTLAKIAGHSSITMTERYVHPQSDAIERAFASVTEENGRTLPKVVTAGGHRENREKEVKYLEAVNVEV